MSCSAFLLQKSVRVGVVVNPCKALFCLYDISFYSRFIWLHL